MIIVRVDDRLVHGQVIEAWLPFTEAKHLVVANDALVHDDLRQQIMSLAVPQHVHIHFIALDVLVQCISECAKEKVFVLLESLQDLERALALYTAHITVTSAPSIHVNIGNVSHGLDKQKIAAHVSVTQDEYQFLQQISEKFNMDFRSVPAEKPRVWHDIIA